jgi:hypothetical protein
METLCDGFIPGVLDQGQTDAVCYPGQSLAAIRMATRGASVVHSAPPRPYLRQQPLGPRAVHGYKEG